MGCHLRRKFVSAVFILFVLAAPVSAFAQISDSLRSELHKASDKLVSIGSKRYLDVDLIADGLLTPGSNYGMKYQGGELWLNDKKLPGRYVTRYKAFYAENYRLPASDFALMNPNGVTLNEIFHPDSILLMSTIENLVGASGGGDVPLTKEQTRKILTHLIALVAADQLADTSKYYTVQFDAKGLMINGRMADATAETRYAQALKSDGFDVKKKGASVWYNNNYRKQWMW